MCRLINLLILALIGQSAISQPTRERADELVWVQYMYNELSAKPEYFGYLDVINRSVQNNLQTRKIPDSKTAFQFGTEMQTSFSRQHNPYELPYAGNPMYDFLPSYISGFMKLSNINAVENSARITNDVGVEYYGYETPVANAFLGKRYLDWSEETVKNVLVQFRRTAMRYPEFELEANKFLQIVAGGIAVKDGYEKIGAKREKDMGVYYQFGTTGWIDGYMQELTQLRAAYQYTPSAVSNVNQKYAEKMMATFAGMMDSVLNSFSQRNISKIRKDEFKENIREAKAAVYTISTVIGFSDPEMGKRLQQLGYGITDMVDGINKLNSGPVTFAASANLLSAALTIYSAFQRSESSPNGFAILAQMLVEMEKRISQKLTGLDNKLDVIINILDQSFQNFQQQLGNLQVDINLVKNYLLSSQEKMYNLEYTFNDYFRDLKNRNLFDVVNKTILYDQYVSGQPLSLTEYSEGIKELMKLLLISSKDNVALGSSVNFADVGEVINRLERNTPVKNIGVLRTLAANIDPNLGYDVSNPDEMAKAAFILIQFIQDWPEYFNKLTPQVFKNVIDACKQTNDFLVKLDSLFLVNKFYSEESLFGNNLNVLKDAVVEWGAKEEELITQQLNGRGSFLPLAEFKKNKDNYPKVVAKDHVNFTYKGGDSTVHQTLNGWVVPLSINAFSSFIPAYKNDWSTWSAINISKQLPDLSAEALNSWVPIFHRNVGIFQQLKYLHDEHTDEQIQIFRGKPEVLKGFNQPRGVAWPIPIVQNAEDLVVMLQDYRITYGVSPPGNICVRTNYILHELVPQKQVAGYVMDRCTNPAGNSDFNFASSQYPKKTKYPDRMDSLLHRNFLDPVVLKMKEEALAAVKGFSSMAKVTRMLQREKLMVAALRNMLLLAHRKPLMENSELQHRIFSDEVYYFRNELLAYSINSPFNLDSVMNKVRRQYEDLKTVLGQQLFTDSNKYAGNPQLNLQILRLTQMASTLQNNGSVQHSINAASRYLKQHVEAITTQKIE